MLHIVIFSCYNQMLKIFESFLISSNYPYLKMDGGTAISARQKLIKKFNEVSNVFIFVSIVCLNCIPDPSYDLDYHRIQMSLFSC